MTALNMVLQRQVPARPVAKAGEADADVAANSRNGAFSAALSQEKRNAIAEREKIPPQDKKDAGKIEAGAEGDEAADELMPESGQPDEILDLLAGLGSGAANIELVEYPETEPAAEPDDAELAVEPGEAGIADPRQAAAATVASDVPVDDAASEEPVAAAVPRAGATGLRNGADNQPKSAVAKGVHAEVKPAAGEAVQPGPATPPAGDAQATVVPAAAVRSSANSPAAVVSATATAMMGKGAQAPATEAGQERQREPSAVKETIRALGLGGASDAAEPDVSESRGRGRNAGRQNATADRQIEERIGPKDGKVEVIESRRFMPAQAMSPNTQLLTRSLVEATGTALAAQRSAPAQPAAETGPSQPAQMLHTLKLQLNPASLGTVTAVLRLTGEELSVEIKVETAEAYRQLKDDNQSILKALRGQGFGVEQITVQHVGSADRPAGQTPQQGFQASQQGAGSNDAQSSGRDDSRNNAGQQGSGPQGGQGHEQGSYSGSAAGRSDGVYL